MPKVLSWLYKEFLEILPVWAFFFLAFGLLALNRMATYGEYHIKPEEPPEYVVGSLIMAKVVVLVDPFYKKRRKPGRPLIGSTLAATGLYFVAGLVLYHVEQVITLVRHQHAGFGDANRETLLEMGKPVFLANLLSVLALTFVFCMLGELIHAIGRERFMQIFFGRGPRPDEGTENIRRAS
jgi:hypothetical protein